MKRILREIPLIFSNNSSTEKNVKYMLLYVFRGNGIFGEMVFGESLHSGKCISGKQYIRGNSTFEEIYFGEKSFGEMVFGEMLYNHFFLLSLLFSILPLCAVR